MTLAIQAKAGWYVGVMQHVRKLLLSSWNSALAAIKHLTMLTQCGALLVALQACGPLLVHEMRSKKSCRYTRLEVCCSFCSDHCMHTALQHKHSFLCAWHSCHTQAVHALAIPQQRSQKEQSVMRKCHHCCFLCLCIELLYVFLRMLVHVSAMVKVSLGR